MSVQCSTPWPDIANPRSITPQKQRLARRKKIKLPNCVVKPLLRPHQRTFGFKCRRAMRTQVTPACPGKELRRFRQKTQIQGYIDSKPPTLEPQEKKNRLPYTQIGKSACHSTFIHQSQCIHTLIDYCSPLLQPAIPQPPHSQHG